MNYNLVQTNLAIVALGYKCTTKDFKNIISEVNKKGFELGERPSELNLPIDIPCDIREEIEKTFPIITYSVSAESDLRTNVVLLANEEKLDISYINYSDDTLNKYANLTKELLLPKSQYISFLGVNFIADYSFKNNQKLKLLNENIININNWEYNKTFILAIPMEYEGFKVTYSIQKMNNENIRDEEERRYRFQAGFEIKVDENLSDRDKQDIIKKVISELDSSYHSEFTFKCKEFLELGNDNK